MHEHLFSNIISKCHRVWLKSYVGPSLNVWLYAHLVSPSFKMASNIFASTLRTKLHLPHPMTCDFFLCICSQAINSTWLHLCCCAHRGERMATHDVVWNSFTSIIRDVRFHVLCKQLHVLSTPSLQSSRWQVDIVFTTHDICTLANIIIVDSTHVDLVSQVVSS